MKNQPSESHWWWLDNDTTVRRSPWLQSTLTELNEKTKAMLKLIEGEADSFAQRAEMFYKKRPELVSLVEDFYKTHRLLAERYDQVRPETAIRHLKTGESPTASFRQCQSEKLMSFDDHGYDSYYENCDVEESVESEIDDPEHEENAKFVDYIEHAEVHSVAANEVMKLRKEIERLGEEKKAHKDQIKLKNDILDEVMMLREQIERAQKENKVQKDELEKKDMICKEIVMKLMEEMEEIKRLKQKDTVCDEVVTKLMEEMEQLKKENEALKNELKMEGTICDEVMKLREEIEQLKKENDEVKKNELKQKDTICNEVMSLREEKERVREENRTQKNDLKLKDIEKIEVIRQLSSTIDVLKQENVLMRSFISKEFTQKWKKPFEFNKIIGDLSKKMFNGIPKNKPSIVAL